MRLIDLKRLAGPPSVVVAALCLSFSPLRGVAAPDASPPLHQLKHTAWGSDRGAPADIIEITQSPDGFLWLATSSGLYRFDGVTFELIPSIPGDRTRSHAVYSVLAARNGDVWVGYQFGGLAVYRNGRLQDANPTKPYGVVWSLRQAPDGSIWMLRANNRSGSQLLRYKDGRWEDRSGIWGKAFPATYDWFVFDRNGTIWIAAIGVIQSVALDGTRHVYRMPRRALPQPDTTGRMWIVTSLGAWPAEQAAALAALPPGGSSERQITWYVHVDPRGAAFMTDTVDGVGLRWIGPRAVSEIRRSAGAGQQETFDRKDGLTADLAESIFEDREGNFWVGTAGGLDQFRRVNLVSEAPRSTLSAWDTRFTRTSDGRVLAIGPTSLEDISDGLPAKRTYHVPDIGAITTMCPDRSGGLWLLWPERVLHWPDGRRLPRLPGGHIVPIACAVDTRDRLWVTERTMGVLRFERRRWAPAPLDPADPHITGLALAADPAGGVIAPVLRDGIYRVSDRGAKKLVTADALGVGTFGTILPRGGAIEVGGEDGVARVDARGVSRLSATDRPWLEGVASILHTPDGETWINAARGVVRLRTQDFDAALSNPSARLPYELFSAAEGYRGSVRNFGNYVTALAPDGRLWFQSNTAWMWLDRAHLHRNPLPPPVVIKAVIAQGKTYAARPDLVLPRGVRNLQIDYTALSLSAPEKVRFLYRLEGVDSGWVDPGQRRQAFYTNLPPGPHRFQVIAANNDGVWNRTGATLDFRIPPTFVQSGWFAALCAAAAALLLWGLYSLRARQIAAVVRVRMQERMAERERIARELHDTFLQSVQGLVLRFQSVAYKIPKNQPARPLLEEALLQADQVLAEGRDRVTKLRYADTAMTLPEILEDSAARILRGVTVEARLVVEGAPRPLAQVVIAELGRISEEFLFNTLQHADASRVEMTIHYGARALLLRLSDNGCGIPPEILKSGQRDGHFGLVGMRERADKLGATMKLTSRRGAGTELVLTLASSGAYSDARPFWRRPKSGGAGIATVGA